MIKLGFEWKKTQTNRSLLMERTDVVVDRINYLRQVRKYRQEGRPVSYTDETFVHTSHSAKRSWQSKDCSIKVPFGKGTRYIVVHAGSENGFLDGAELVFKAKSTTGDYHDEMKSTNFFQWTEKQLIPDLPPHSVLVIDGAPYHKIQEDKCPTMANNKKDFSAWMDRNSVAYTTGMFMVELISRCKMSCPRPTYKLDVMMGKHGHNVLRLPAYHAELNPIELIWAQVKGAIAKNNTTFTTTDMIPMIKNGFAQVSAQDWKKCCRHVMNIEDKYWESDIAKDGEMDKVEFIVCSEDEDTDTASSEGDYSDTDSDFENH